MVDVTDRVEPAGALDAAAVVDGEPGAGCQAHRLQSEVVGARGPSGGEEDLVRLDVSTARQLHGDRAVRDRAPYGGDRDPGAEVGARLGEGPTDQFAGEGLHLRQESLATDQHRHPGAEGLPDGGHLHSDHTAADDHEPARHLLGAGRLPAGPGAGPVDAGEVGHDGAAAGADGDGVAGGEPVLGAVGRGDGHRLRAGEPAPAAVEVRADALQPGDLAVVLPVRGVGVAVGEDRRGVQRPLHGVAEARDAAGVGAGDHRAQQGLAGHAGPVGAFAADQFRLDDRGAQPGGPRPVGDVLAHRTRSDHHDVVLGVLGSICHGDSLVAGVRGGHMGRRNRAGAGTVVRTGPSGHRKR